MRRKRKTSIIKVVYLILLLQLIGLILIYHFFYKNDIIKILPEGFIVSNKKLNPNNKGETLFFNDDFGSRGWCLRYSKEGPKYPGVTAGSCSIMRQGSGGNVADAVNKEIKYGQNTVKVKFYALKG